MVVGKAETGGEGGGKRRGIAPPLGGVDVALVVQVVERELVDERRGHRRRRGSDAYESNDRRSGDHRSDSDSPCEATLAPGTPSRAFEQHQRCRWHWSLARKVPERVADGQLRVASSGARCTAPQV